MKQIQTMDSDFCAKRPCCWSAANQIVFSFVRSSVRAEVIENLRAAYRGWTHSFPYAGFDHLIFQDFKKSKKGPSCFSFKT